MGCSGIKSKSQVSVRIKSQMFETNSINSTKAKRSQICTSLSESDLINKKKMQHVPKLDMTKSGLYASRMSKAKINSALTRSTQIEC
ncbi:hypothetical protein SteCoe_33797 [Stentor coeruleus]|uniref:Uncharacterized protein n=1 Tax=Stentor coeruleus TaxID=5963 RepID=A0A1R2AWC0_9CILI|nr:hypothetical protein SteCoe_33797 [Stentor coeruleus]